MPALTLTLDSYRQRVLAAWQGKSAGITLGAPARGQTRPLQLQGYPQAPGQPASSIALDFPLTWLHAMEKHGPAVTSDDLAVARLLHLDSSEDELGYSWLNLRRGLPPPACGAFSNWFRNGSAALERADFWALVAPGSPQVAAAYAYEDACVDHSEEGIWAAMFLAAACSAAFFLTDQLALLTIGLAMIPRTCRTARAMKAALAVAQRGGSWLEARESVIAVAAAEDWASAPLAMGFFAIGLLYGRNQFGPALCAGINCGYDTVATGSALGAFLGIRHSAAPAEFVAPLHDLLIPGDGLRDLDGVTSLTAAANRTVELGRQVVADRCLHLALVEQQEAAPATAMREAPAAAAAVDPAGPLLGEARANAEVASSSAPTAAPPPGAPAPMPVRAPETPPQSLTGLSGQNGEAQQGQTGGIAIPVPGAAAAGEAAEPGADEPVQPDAVKPQPAAGAAETDAGTAAAPAEMQSPLLPQPVAVQAPAAAQATLPAPDLAAAFAWADSSAIKPLLVASPTTLNVPAPPLQFALETHDGPVIGYETPKLLSVKITNEGSELLSGQVALLAPAGWQSIQPANLGQRQYIAPGGAFTGDWTVRVPDSQGKIEVSNSVVVQFSPEGAGEAVQAQFVLLGAACWWTVGPFANYDGDGFDRVYGPEEKPDLNEPYLSRTGQPIRWERQVYPEAVLPLEPLFHGSSGVCYGRATLVSPTAREARIVANTNSGIKVWLNKSLVFRRHNRQPFRPMLGAGPWAADISLQQGANSLMLKWVRGVEPFAFSLTVADREGRGLPEVGTAPW